jgi:uncharacterized protein
VIVRRVTRRLPSSAGELIQRARPTLVLITLLAPTSAVAVPPPPVQVTASCATPTYASDELVCADGELRELDALLAGLIARRSERAAVSSSDESDAEWFRRSRKCAFQRNHRTCLLRAYCERIVLLSGVSGKPPPGCKHVTPNQRRRLQEDR